MCEVVSVSRLNAKDQKTVGKFNEPEEARAFMEEQRKAEPLRYLVMYVHLSPFCRLVGYHTL